jgi:hypothetical protein
MPLPRNTTSSIFSSDQTVVFKATYWDTTMTVPQKGVRYAAFDVLTPAVNPTNIKDLFTDQTKTRSILGYTGGDYRKGLVPNVCSFWGPGAPPGVQTARRVALHFGGTVTGVSATDFGLTLILGGQGRVEVWKNGAKVISGTLHEPVVDVSYNSLTEIERSTGMLIRNITLKNGDTVDIYYLQNGEPWGGIFAKALPAADISTDWTILRRQIRDAAMVGSSFITAGAATETEIPYLVEAKVDNGAKEMSERQLTVALTTSGEPDGFYVESSTGEVRLVDNANESFNIRPDRLVSFEAGYLTGGAEEIYPRFKGFVSEIVPDQAGATATITCLPLETRLERAFDENYPDTLSYLSAGFTDREWLGYPVYGVQAFDSWPLEAAVAECCYRAGIDAYSLGKSVINSDPNHGRRQFRTNVRGLLVYGSHYFRCRTPGNLNEPVWLQRRANYGNIGPSFKESLPSDDEYLYGSELSERLLDRVISLCEQYGYDFEFNVYGQAVINARNNPVRFTPFT